MGVKIICFTTIFNTKGRP